MTFQQPSADDQQNQDQQNQTGSGVHSSWDGVLEMFPEGAQRDALISQIRESERNASTAIQKASEAAAPEDWRELIDQAKQVGLTPEELSQSYNQFEEMREQIASDPDGWLDGMKNEIDQAVQRGDITRKEGAQLKKDAATQAAAGDAGVDLEDPDVAELRKEVEAQKQWRQQQEQQAREAQERFEEEEQQRLVQENTNRFVKTVEDTFSGDASLANVEPKTRYIVANHALALLESNQGMTEQQATDEAVKQFRELNVLPAAGVSTASMIPIGGGSNQRIQAPTAAGRGDARGVDKTREQAMLEALAQAQASGIA